MRLFSLKALAFHGLLSGSLAQHAEAYRPYKVCPFNDIQTWDNGTFVGAMSTTTFTFTFAERAEIQAGLTEWDNDVIGRSSLNVVTTLSSLNQFDPNDGVNLMGYADLVNGQPFAPMVPVLLDIRGNSCLDFNEIVEVDFLYNGPVAFSSLRFDTQFSYFDYGDADEVQNPFINVDFRSVTTRAAGWGFGFANNLRREDFFIGTMGHLGSVGYRGGGTAIGEQGFLQRRVMVNEDERVGVRDYYPASSPTVVDVAVQSYIYDPMVQLTGACGVSARPSPSLPGDLAPPGMTVGCAPLDANNPNSVKPSLVVLNGSEVEFTFSLLNLGTAGQSVTARIIATPQDSTNPTTFTVLDSFGPTINPNVPFQVTRSVVMPPSLINAGEQFILLQIDPGGALSESDETNNAAFWNRKLEVVGIPPDCSCSATTSGGAGGLLTLGALLVIGRRRREVQKGVSLAALAAAMGWMPSAQAHDPIADQLAGFCPISAGTIYPKDGDIVPRNANVNLYTTFGGAFLEWELAVDGVIVPYTRMEYQVGPNASYSALVLDPVDDFPPGAQVSLLSNGTPALSFTVADFRDTEPPVWDGTVNLTADKGRPFRGDDRFYRHGFVFGGLSDDDTDWMDLMVVGEPDVGDQGFAGPLVSMVSRPGYGCPGDDSLPSTFHRIYSVRFFDGAGNVAGPYDVEIGRPGCGGCTSGASPIGLWGGVAGVLSRRR